MIGDFLLEKCFVLYNVVLEVVYLCLLLLDLIPKPLIFSLFILLLSHLRLVQVYLTVEPP